jgi:hypothetical protein
MLQPADGLWTESEAFPKSFEECVAVDKETGNITKIKGRGASDNRIYICVCVILFSQTSKQ